ncbi:hypothetical protein [Subsaximicrobium wynnwilliamsii]|jgi:hypothetical protein|uniref:hypothetical protein n=1 Tax=Subsaximicrobium wynnwilliamsii TaxID=291179 RepID=UPI0016719DBE|nr:hypothetical protein [Subsaximicrobium wynnwilliamsii]
MATKGKFWTQRKPADMHGDGVHFNEEQLARKEAKEKEDKENENNAVKPEE